MSISEELYTRLEKAIMPIVKVKHKHQLSNWLWIVSGILQSKSVALGQIANYLPMETKAEARITCIRRWLKNEAIHVWSLYEPILEQALRGWQAEEVVIILDGVMVFGDRLQIFRLSLEHGCRAIPLGWVVLEGKGLTRVEKLKEMLEQVADFLKSRVQSVVFLADRGFRDCDWANLCQELGWKYAIRLASNTYVTLENGSQVSIDALGVQVGDRQYFQNVKVTQDEKLQGNLSVTWTNGNRGQQVELLAVISNRPAEKARLNEYARRMRIEESFRDDQSGGFDLEHTRLEHPERLEKLLLAVAIATLWCHEIGEQILQNQTLQDELDPGGKKRELSIFQLGLRFIKRCIAVALERLPNFNLQLTNFPIQPVLPRLPKKCQ
jgi:Transposase DDE domain